MKDSILEIFRCICLKYEKKSAIIHNEYVVTYSELDRRSDELASHLVESGYTSGSVIGLYFNRSVELIVSILACIKAKVIYVPLSDEYPSERLEYLIRSSGIKYILVGSKEPLLRNVKVKIEKYSTCFYRVQTHKIMRADTKPLDEICIIFTSGSTGYPKGISIRAQGILRLVVRPNYIKISDTDVISHASNISFDAINFEIWAALLNGGTLSIVDKEIIISPDLFRKYLIKDRISILFLTTRLFNLNIKYSKSCFEGVRYVLFGGEAANASLLNEYMTHNICLPENLINVYGPTECSTFATFYHLPNDSAVCNVIPIGRPITDTLVYVVNEDMTPVGKNEIGQIILGGKGVSSGYIDNDDLNSVKFFECSFHPGERFYATGDLGYFDNNQNLVYVSRSDRQLKINGYRVEPNEIERVILKCRDVTSVYVSVNPGENESNAIVAYIAVDNPSYNLNGLADILHLELPKFMLPTKFKILDKIPLNGNGKVDVEALEVVRSSLVSFVNAVALPSTPEEKFLVDYVYEISKIQIEDIDISLFDYGFDSLLIFRLCSGIQIKYCIKLAVYELVKLLTVRAIAEFINERKFKPDFELTIPKFSGLATSVPSLAQSRLWVLYKLNKTLVNYNEIFIFKISGYFDVPRFEIALNKLIYKHQALRSRFYEEDGSPKLILEDEPKFVINVNNSFKVNNCRNNVSGMENLLANILNFKFELNKWPLFTVDVFEVLDGENILIFNFSHIIIDGWSLPIFFQELSRLYSDIPFQDSDYPKVEYFDYTKFISNTQGAAMMEGQVEYWREYLKGFNGFVKEIEYPCHNIYDAHTTKFSLGTELVQQIDEIKKSLNITTSAIIITAYAIMVFQYIDYDDLLIAMPTANRRIGQSEKLIGFIANTVPIRFKNSPLISAKKFLANAAESIYRALDNQDISYDEILKLREAFCVDRLSEFNPFFVMQNNQSYTLSMPNAEVEEQECQLKLAKFDILLSAFEKKGNISIELTCRSQKFSRDTMGSMAKTFLDVLNRLSLNDDCEVKSFFKPVMYRELIADTKFNLGDALNDIFLRSSDKIAVIDGCEIFTYRQIDELSNQFAHYLSERGLKDAGMLGVYSGKSLYFVIALIACIKLNLTFMPLDREYPEKYLKTVIDSSGVQVVVSLCETMDVDVPAFITHNVDKNSLLSSSKKHVLTQSIGNSPLYFIFTSGSTGEPKGIRISRDVIENLLEFQRDSLKMNDCARTLQYSSINFDVAIQEILTVLCFGGSLVLIDSEVKRDNIKLIKLIIENKIERIILPYVKLQSLSATCADLDLYPQSLREIISTGEQMICSSSIKELYKKQVSCRIFNMYGPSETHAVTFYELCSDVLAWPNVAPLGSPIYRTQIYVVNESGELSVDGEVGEICIAGLTAKYSYANDSYKSRYGIINYLGNDVQIYKTGDLGFKDASGQYNFVCREDKQYKVNGYMVNTAYIESVILGCRGVRDVCVEICDEKNHRYMHAYIVADKFNVISTDSLRGYLVDNIPTHMCPSKISFVDEMPYTLSGKLDRKRLSLINNSLKDERILTPLEGELLKIFSLLLNVDSKNLDDNFFDLGAGSLLLANIHSKIYMNICPRVELLDLFKYPTIRKLANFITTLNESSVELGHSPFEYTGTSFSENDNHKIAVIGISGKFPGADNIYQFWHNTINENNSVRELSIKNAGDNSSAGSRYINHCSTMNGIFKFNPEYFGISEKDACLMDPQHRHFLMGAVEALDSTKYDYRTYNGKIGVVGSCAENTYNSALDKVFYKEKNSVSDFQWAIASEKDFIATKASYYLNLRGPSYTIQSACSSSLVSIHVACSQLRQLEADLVVVGSVSIDFSSLDGYEYKEGHIYSADGYCRPFDIKSSGTYGANGCGFVVLKLLRNAIKDGDKIYSIIEGSSLNNDGRLKVGFTAPSIDGQVDVLKSAIENSGVSPASVAYIEAHGTATRIGDAIEIAAIKEVYSREFTSVKSVAVSSLKSQIGHMAAAAGIAGFIRAVLALYYKKIPVCSNFTSINPNIDIENSSIYINSETSNWDSVNHQRYAGVSSFGVGGTNAHVVLSDRYVVRSKLMNEDKIMRSENRQEMKDYNLLPSYKITKSEKIREPIERWLYRPTWAKSSNHQAVGLRSSEQINNNYVVIVGDYADPLVNEIISNFKQARNNLVVVQLSDKFEFVSTTHIKLDKNRCACYSDLLTYLSQHMSQFNVLYMPMLGVSSASYEETSLVDLRCSTYYPILFFIKAYDAKFKNQKLRITSFSRNLFSVTGNERLQPWASLILGVMRVFPLEYDYVTCKHIDLGCLDSENLMSHDLKNLIYFCEHFDKTPNLIALRNGFFWEQVMLPLDLAKQSSIEPFSFKVGGTYLITGGTGELGLEMAKLILNTSGVNIILLSRSGSVLDSFRLNLLRQIAATSNSKIDLMKCDVSDCEDLKMKLGLIFAKYSTINGIIHSAGISDSGISLRKALDDCEVVLKSKVDGLINFDRLVDINKLDFFVNFSSVASYFGEFGQFVYCSANSFLDEYSVYMSAKYPTTKCVSIAWDTWAEGGMAINSNNSGAIKDFQDREINMGILRSEGSLIFTRAMNVHAINLIVSTVDLKHRASLRDSRSIEVNQGVVNQPVKDVLSYIIELFGRHLGVCASADTNIFHSGGDSLMAVEFLADLNNSLSSHVSLSDLLVSPTPCALFNAKFANLENPYGNYQILRQGSLSRKLFFVHPVTGDIFCYLDISKKILSEYEVIGIFDPIILGDRMHFDSLVQKASWYVEQVKKCQPVGPYCLAGWSFGGLLVHEMARCLIRAGDEVSFLCVIDPPSLNKSDNGSALLLSKDIEAFSGLAPPDSLNGAIVNRGLASEYIKTIKEATMQNLDLMSSYIAESCIVKRQILIIASMNMNSNLVLEWEQVTSKKLISYYLEGDHYTIMKEPCVDKLIKLINYQLAEIDSECMSHVDSLQYGLG